MAMKNKLKLLLEEKGMSVYEFRKLSGLAAKTAYDLVGNPEQIPSGKVLHRICESFRIQPNDFLEWIPDDQEQAS
jgi:DNA-binding Xre family transcriptional regulator